MNSKYYLAIRLLLTVSSLMSAQIKSIDMQKDESFITYRLHHPLHEMESTSKDVVCKIMVDPAIKEIKSVSAQVDVTTFNSGNSNRDSHAMEVIDAIMYPEADFVSTSVARNGDSVNVAGMLTFHGVTKSIILQAACKWFADKLKVEGHFDLSMTEFKIERPALLLIPVDDALKFSFVAIFNY